MVLQQQVGRERSFGIVVLLFVITFGIYGIFWNYKAHHEAFTQFELTKDGKDEGIIWLILGLVLFPPLQWIYHSRFVGNVQHIRRRMKMRPGISPGKFLGLTIPGAILNGAAFYLLVFGLIFMAAEETPDDPLTSADETITAEEAADLNSAGETMVPIGAVLLAGGLALLLSGYAMLQSSLNQIWRLLPKRIAQVNAEGLSGGQTGSQY